MTMERVDIRLFDLRNVPQLAGSAEGVGDGKRIRHMLHDAHQAIVVFDFAEIRIFTPSYFKAALMPIWTDPGTGREFFPVLKNVRGAIEEDLMVSMEWYGVSIWEENAAGRGVLEYGPFAKLEGWMFDTLSIVAELKQVTAGLLAGKYRDISSTAWSNRLAALYDRRLLARYKQGRQLVYVPPWMFNAVQNDVAIGQDH